MLQTYVKLLQDFVAIPSIGTDPQFQPKMEAAAQWLTNHLAEIGMEHVQLLYPASKRGHPVVYGDWLHAGKDKPTLLIYTHYDVQPADPLDQWATDPWTVTSPPTTGEEKQQDPDWLCGRGVADDKGHTVAVLVTLKDLLSVSTTVSTKNSMPLQYNIKVIIEGEEEQGSPSFHDILVRHTQLLQHQVALILDTGQTTPNQPIMETSLRGLVFLGVNLKVYDHDLHSGLFGGGVLNPAIVLTQILSQITDDQNRITIPHFYDDVIAQSYEPLAIDPLFTSACARSEPGYSAIEQATVRPSFDINGIWSGYTGVGTKTIIPSEAHAKISFRLAGNQKPQHISKLIKAWIQAQLPSTCQVEFEDYTHAGPVFVDPSHPYIQRMKQAQERHFDQPMQYTKIGGTIGATGDLQDLYQTPLIITGFTLEPSNLHAPNEQLHLPTMLTGIAVLKDFLTNQ